MIPANDDCFIQSTMVANNGSLAGHNSKSAVTVSPFGVVTANTSPSHRVIPCLRQSDLFIECQQGIRRSNRHMLASLENCIALNKNTL